MAKSFVLSQLRNVLHISRLGSRTLPFKPNLGITNVRLNSTFEAACLTEYGKPLVIEKFNKTALKADEVRIQVKYCSLNNRDVEYLEKKTKKEKTLPFIPGYELSGEVIEVGPECSKEINVGQRVVGLAVSGHGGLASEATLLAGDTWPLPSDVRSKDAAALICGHSTALLAFTEYRPLNEGDVILVIAGPAGYGLAAVEVAASIFKAKVIALADTEGKAGLLRDRGAFAAFKSDLKHNYKEIMNATDNKGVHLIYDAVGGPILNTVIKCIQNPAEGMILKTYRVESSEDSEDEDKQDKRDGETETSKTKSEKDKPETISSEIREKLRNVNIFDYRKEDHEKYYNLIEQTIQFCEEQLVTAHVSQSFDLDKTNEAIQYIKGKFCTGKVLIKIDD